MIRIAAHCVMRALLKGWIEWVQPFIDTFESQLAGTRGNDDRAPYNIFIPISNLFVHLNEKERKCLAQINFSPHDHLHTLFAGRLLYRNAFRLYIWLNLILSSAHKAYLVWSRLHTWKMFDEKKWKRSENTLRDLNSNFFFFMPILCGEHMLVLFGSSYMDIEYARHNENAAIYFSLGTWSAMPTRACTENRGHDAHIYNPY